MILNSWCQVWCTCSYFLSWFFTTFSPVPMTCWLLVTSFLHVPYVSFLSRDAFCISTVRVSRVPWLSCYREFLLYWGKHRALPVADVSFTRQVPTGAVGIVVVRLFQVFRLKTPWDCWRHGSSARAFMSRCWEAFCLDALSTVLPIITNGRHAPW